MSEIRTCIECTREFDAKPKREGGTIMPRRCPKCSGDKATREETSAKPKKARAPRAAAEEYTPEAYNADVAYARVIADLMARRDALSAAIEALSSIRGAAAA